MNISKGRRVYILKSGNFGNIVKSGGILGMKESYAAVDDTGSRIVFMGKSSDDFAYTDTGMTPSGDNVDIPRDGVSMIETDESMTRVMSNTLVKRYISMDKADRHSFCEKWEAMSSEEKRAISEGERPGTRNRSKK